MLQTLVYRGGNQPEFHYKLLAWVIPEDQLSAAVEILKASASVKNFDLLVAKLQGGIIFFRIRLLTIFSCKVAGDPGGPKRKNRATYS